MRVDGGSQVANGKRGGLVDGSWYAGIRRLHGSTNVLYRTDAVTSR